TLLLVVAVAPTLAGLFGRHEVIFRGNPVYVFDGSNLVLLIGGLLAVVVGFLALRQMDDRKGLSIVADLVAAVRGQSVTPESAEQPRGMFIAFEGGEGSGKTTQSRLLAIWLRDQGFDVVQTREPGSTKVGMRLRAILLDAVHQGLSARSEALLYAADRAEHVEKVIRPALDRGSLVISDRYVDSSLAYQGAGRALDPADVAKINRWATGGLVPDLTVLIDTPPSVGLARLGGAADRIESEPLEFHERVRREFRALAAADPDRYLVVDGTLAQERISLFIHDRMREILPDPVPQESEDATGTIPVIRD
ncbi:dTMP kinase, partial [Streptomyces anulatus]|uniref:dTMP kinase n=1 Tax=Streptomyces anulatus TaxID=1892 RepID=UPI003423496C